MADKLSWCFNQKRGIRIIEPNVEIAKAYLADAKRDFSLVDIKEPKWNIIKEYYVCYNSLYSLLARCGIKCEIHDCTINLMNLFNYDKRIINGLIDLKKERMNVQYYLGKSRQDYYKFTKEFLNLSEIKLMELNDFKVKELRTLLK